jgi:hypothetical protein
MDILLGQYLKSKNSSLVNYEFEMRFKHYNTPLQRSDYNSVIEWLLLSGFKLMKEQSLFRISMGKDIRAELNTIEEIKQYCETQEAKLKFVQKQQVIKPVINDNYNINFSLNSETQLSDEQYEKPASELKTFRFMKRLQFQHPDHPSFCIDCSIVKMEQNSVPKMMHKVFGQKPSYEIEAEFLEQPSSKEELNKEIKFAMTSVLKGLQKTNFPISYKEIEAVKQEYQQLFPSKKNDFQFIGPNTVTLQQEHYPLLTEETFMVTDKADGERKLLFISAKNKKIYLINTMGHVENTNCIPVKSADAFLPIVLDGEHVFKTKYGEICNTFFAFDVYFIPNHYKQFITKKYETDKEFFNFPDKDIRVLTFDQRYEVLTHINSVFLTQYFNTPSHKYTIARKNFLPYTQENCKIIYEDNSSLYHKDGLIFTPRILGVGLTSKDQPIKNERITWDLNFKWKPPDENTIDFYVKIDDTLKTTVNGKKFKTLTLYSSYHSSPHVHSKDTTTITDFTVCPSVSVYQNFPINEHKNIKFVGGQPYDVKAHVCNCYTNEYDNVCTSNEVDPKKIEIVEDGFIVEFKYDLHKEQGWRWSPLRIRWDKKNPNAYTTAVNNWKSINNPITYEMLTDIKYVPPPIKVYYEQKDKSVGKATRDFHNKIKTELLTTLAHLHRKSAHKDPMIIDFASGKGGDIHKWVDNAKSSFVLGIDINSDNIHNPMNGAFQRVLSKKINQYLTKQRSYMPDIVFVEGNSSLLIKNGDSLTHEYEKQIIYYLFGLKTSESYILPNIPYGHCKDGFDIGSIQFALHYMFDSENSILNFIYNLMDCIKIGGYFCATCFDGEAVFQLLKDIHKNEIMEKYAPFSSIQKMYDNTDKELNMSHYVPMAIGVKQETLNDTEFYKEYLVFADYFIHMMKLHGFELVQNIPEFPNGTGLFRELDFKGKDILEKDENQKGISYLNRYYIFQKHTNAMKARKVYENKHLIKVKIN